MCGRRARIQFARYFSTRVKKTSCAIACSDSGDFGGRNGLLLTTVPRWNVEIVVGCRQQFGNSIRIVFQKRKEFPQRPGSRLSQRWPGLVELWVGLGTKLEGIKSLLPSRTYLLALTTTDIQGVLNGHRVVQIVISRLCTAGMLGTVLGVICVPKPRSCDGNGVF